MLRLIILLGMLLMLDTLHAQLAEGRELEISIISPDNDPMPGATVSLLKKDSSVVSVEVTGATGKVLFRSLVTGHYLVRVTSIGYLTSFTKPVDLVNNRSIEERITMQPDATLLKDVSVTTRKPPVQFLPDKTVVNVDASITSAGGSVMDVLEKSPGITIGRDGNIIMKGKPQVMVLIDGKSTQLTGTELQAYLSGISASQVATIELIDNPGARYEAAGNAGIINIRTKTSRQKGFNGSLSLSMGQGFFPKTNNSLNLNYRYGKFNLFLNYGNRFGKERMKIGALRKYHDVNGNDSLLLQQPNITRTDFAAHNVKTGVDYFVSSKTTMGVSFTGNITDREVNSFSTIDWMSPDYVIDSTIFTSGTRENRFERAGLNFYTRHTIDSRSEIGADIDFIQFDINGDQYFQTQLLAPGSMIQATKGNIPSRLKIFAAKIDYSKKFNNLLWEAGLKTARTNTDNLAEYYYHDGNNWQDDLGRSNHFLYDEKIHSVYSSIDKQNGKWHWQTGLRYEFTSYKASQLGNAVVKDSTFKKNYGSLFPSAFVAYNVDSSNTITLRMGRRIDRPQFQNLNPFLVTLNKYTFESGNPFIKPQYTWNFELTHNYKNILSTGISYSYLKDYFSQIFIIDSNSNNVNKNIIIYTRGNVGTFHNFGVSATLQLPITKWWSITSTVIYNHKNIIGIIWEPIKATINQVNFSLNNQYKFGKGWSAEISGYYLSKSQIDLQEYLTPQGELGAGISKQIMQNKGTIRLAIRDIFYTQNYSGYSYFENSDEPFDIKWDSRVVRLTFSWRFGKAMKAIKRTGGGATEETERVGNIN
jgi:iron complex outermembrane receptor protein